MGQKTHEKTVPKNVDAYLATMPDDARALLDELRQIIHAAAPEATEGISYGMPVFRYRGNLMWLGGYKKHCSLFGIGSATLDRFRDELADHRTPKGALHFRIGTPIPSDLLTRLVRACVEEKDRVTAD